MAGPGLGKILGHLDRQAGVPDGQLLERFVAARDDASFAALVRRHGPMVLGVCRRLLRHEQDAEDAFQATFVVLARKAAAVVRTASLGAWLYAVACRTARAARRALARRRARERQAAGVPHPETALPEPQDWRHVLDEEIGRLPEKYRTAVVLCDLEGRPRKEAAALLAVPEGTLSSRLATGRRLLAERLGRRGLALPGGAIAAALAEETPAAAAAAAGRRAVSFVRSALTTGLLKTLLLAPLKAAALAAAALGAIGLPCQEKRGLPSARYVAPHAPIRSRLSSPDGEEGLRHHAAPPRADEAGEPYRPGGPSQPVGAGDPLPALPLLGS